MCAVLSIGCDNRAAVSGREQGRAVYFNTCMPQIEFTDLTYHIRYSHAMACGESRSTGGLPSALPCPEGDLEAAREMERHRFSLRTTWTSFDQRVP